MTISLKEILMNRIEFKDLSSEYKSNILELLERINVIRTAYGKPMKVNDGYRRPEDTPKNGAKASKHLTGQAIDIDDDESGTIWKWLMQATQMQLLVDTGLWLEHGCYTHNKNGTWIHFQIIPPVSNKRIFIPSNNPNPAPNFWTGIYDKKYDLIP